MRISVVGSVLLHSFILFFTIVSLPLFNNNELEMPPIIQVELIEIAEETNVPQISKKKEDKKLEKEVDEPNENTVALFSYDDKYTYWKGDAILRDKENEGSGNLDWEKDAEDRVKAKIGYGTYGKVKA